MALLDGEDALHQVNFPYTLYNEIKNHWRSKVAPTDIQPGMIWSDSDDDKLYHHQSGGDVEILQLSGSADVTPVFTTIKLSALTDGYIPYHVSDAAGLADSPIFINGADVGIGYSTVAGKFNVVKASGGCFVNFDTYDTTPADCSRLQFRTSDSDVLGTKSETQDGDTLGRIAFFGVDDASSFQEGVRIIAKQNGAAGTGEVPADLILETFSATARNADQLVLHHDGNVGIGTASPGATLDVRANDSYFGATEATIYFATDEINCRRATDANASLYINYRGYAGGATQFRDIRICDGKNNIFATFDGSAETLTVTGCVADGTCEIMKDEDALAIIDDILKTGSGKKDKYKHERMDMKKIHGKYPFMIHEQINKDKDGKKKIGYFDKLGAKSDLIYVAIGQLREKIEALEAMLDN